LIHTDVAQASVVQTRPGAAQAHMVQTCPGAAQASIFDLKFFSFIIFKKVPGS
jgi:hypothetical protein